MEFVIVVLQGNENRSVDVINTKVIIKKTITCKLARKIRLSLRIVMVINLHLRSSLTSN
jgi:hypothetical protein